MTAPARGGGRGVRAWCIVSVKTGELLVDTCAETETGAHANYRLGYVVQPGAKAVRVTVTEESHP